MNGEEKLNEFLDAIERWKSSKHLASVEQNEEISSILNMKYEDLKSLTSPECLCYAYELYAYAEYVETLLNKEKTILEWSDSSIWFIISKHIDQYGDKYAKWQVKYFAAVRENPLATEILKVKNYAEARVRELSGKHERIMKMAEVLNSLSKRK